MGGLREIRMPTLLIIREGFDGRAATPETKIKYIMKHTAMNKDNSINIIKQIPIRDYLARRGIFPSTERTTHGVYLSPYRQERDPSFRVDYHKNLWYDFGTSEGGSIIDIVMKMEHCNCKEAIRLLDGQPFTNIVPITQPKTPKREIQRSPIEILDVEEITTSELLAYANERGINTPTLRLYCSEVHYRIGHADYRAIGFRNDSDGWELRNRERKISNSPKDITIIDRDSTRVAVFEGFFDFLSAIMLGIGNQIDILVLNSVSNLQRATAYLLHHKAINLFLDNDEAGRRATRQIAEIATSLRIYDYAPQYGQYNDLNEYLTSTQPCHTKK